MQTTPEVEAFIARVEALPPGPGVNLDQALQPSLDDEAQLRKLFATDRQNTRLSNPHVGLIDVFAGPDAIRTTRARVVHGEDDLSAKYVMPLSEKNRREEGTPSVVASLEEFKKNWAIFTEGSLSQLIDWNNVVAAGGAVLACLTPLDEAAKVSKRSIRKYYHSAAYPTSDVDLFLWGMTPEQAEVKITAIYEAVRDSVPWDVTCIRTKHTVSIHSQYPYRSIQIVLRLYHSPAEIMAGFDIDAPCCAYDGNRVWANPRAIVALMRQCNTIDVTRRSPSYEVRLAKYSGRAFEVYVPTLKREDIDPTIYERSIARMEGLARLLVLEKLTDTDTRYAFLENRRALRGRPDPLNKYNRRRKRPLKGDLKAETAIGGLEMNDYDVVSLHIPYGPGWDARRIDKLVYATDLGMNSTFNPKNKGRRLHRHPAFFGTIEECLADCCEACPKPIDDDERKLQSEEDEQYIRDRIKFMEENPGRQSMTGSFNPIDDGEWSGQVYIKPTQLLFGAIAARDRENVQKLLKQEIDVNQRDHVGRTTLHVAILSGASAIACDLIDAGARITARLVDGKTPLHLASQYDQLSVIRKLFEKNAQHVEEIEKKTPADGDAHAKSSKEALERPSSEDDWSSHDDEDIDMIDADDEDGDNEDNSNSGDDDDNATSNDNKGESPSDAETPSGDLPEDEEDQPDIIDVNMLDWDFGFSALSYAILFASLPVLEALLTAGADVKLATKPATTHNSVPLHPLSLAFLRTDEDEACKVVERLILAGATSSTANDTMHTIFHSAVQSGRTKIVSTILRCDPHAGAVINFPAVHHQSVVFPVITAIVKKDYSVLAVMLAHGAKLQLDEADITRAQEAAYANRYYMFGYGDVKNYLELAHNPIETAIAMHDDVVQLLIALDALDLGLKRALIRYSRVDERRTVSEFVSYGIGILSGKIDDIENEVVFTFVESDKAPVAATARWKHFYTEYKESLKGPRDGEEEAETPREEAERQKLEKLEKLKDTKAYLVEIKKLLEARGTKSWNELYPELESKAQFTATIRAVVANTPANNAKSPPPNNNETSYVTLSGTGYHHQRVFVPHHLITAYDELYEACYSGDNEKIQKLCLPADGATQTPNLLTISVRMIESSVHTYNYGLLGYTPLFAALAGRRWSTAKLIVAIATAQYHPGNDDEKIEFNTKDMDLDEDSDNESCDSDDSDITIDQKEVKFVDIATRSSAVQCDIHPRRMLMETRASWRKGNEKADAHPLQKAVLDHDLEAFVHIVNLYQSLPQPLEISQDILAHIFKEDQPEILDEYIRRTGLGVVMKGSQDEEIDVLSAVNDKNRFYLGLNVHGKKRADLASRNDPNSTRQEEYQIPLLWTAAISRAKGIIAYLAGNRPLIAYRYYASTHSDERAIWFRRTADLEKLLPEWLGWTINHLGDSPLIAAIIGNNVDVIKLLFKESPRLMSSALQQKIKFVGVNPLIFAVSKTCRTEVFDFLLSKSVSPAERDSIKGWNIYHYICVMNDGDSLEYFLRKLPRDVNEALLAQQSKVRLNTPLQIAVNSGHKRLVQLIIDYSKSTLLTRNVDGQNPIHAAVSAKYPEITRMLVAVADVEDLQTEDGVGQTVLEIASLKELDSRMKQKDEARYFQRIPDLNPSSVESQSSRYDKRDIERLEKVLPKLRTTLNTLHADGRLKVQTKLASELTRFATMMEERLASRKAVEAARPPPPPPKHKVVAVKNPRDYSDVEGTLQHVLAALEACTATRRLVHLIDVQRSVGANLAKVATSRYQYQRANHDGLEDEEDSDEREKKQSMVLQHINTAPDSC
ncbi:hypothetical protein B0H34DRAFT_647969 [Crassisporium funariophilum]|nr:hypothetical protein B0H34DRAFT_647969 [Crassisporium funariophilum]